MRRVGTAGVVAGLLAALTFGLAVNPSIAAAETQLTGTFAITAGTCSGAMSGSFFRMILPTGGPTGPYVSNADSPCPDQTYAPLFPGADGGLVSGAYQQAPSPAFDSDGNGLASRIIQPTPFFGVAFAVSSEPVDPQTGANTPPPTVSVDASGQLTANLSAFGAWWNKQTFNQGSPKPDGSYPGNSAKVTGTYDAATGAYSMTWLTQIVGGPFDNFTGVWHLEGVFRPAGVPATGSERQTAPAGGAGSTDTNASAAPAGAPTGDSAVSTTVAAAAASDNPQGAGPSAQAAGGETVTSQVVTTREGSRPAAWLVLLIAAVGVTAASYLAWTSRAMARRAGASS